MKWYEQDVLNAAVDFVNDDCYSDEDLRHAVGVYEQEVASDNLRKLNLATTELSDVRGVLASSGEDFSKVIIKLDAVLNELRS